MKITEDSLFHFFTRNSSNVCAKSLKYTSAFEFVWLNSVFCGTTLFDWNSKKKYYKGKTKEETFGKKKTYFEFEQSNNFEHDAVMAQNTDNRLRDCANCRYYIDDAVLQDKILGRFARIYNSETDTQHKTRKPLPNL